MKDYEEAVINLRKIRGLRAEHGETQNDIAKLLNINTSSYQNKEWGITEFKPSELKALADHWEAEVKDLFNE